MVVILSGAMLHRAIGCEESLDGIDTLRSFTPLRMTE